MKIIQGYPPNINKIRGHFDLSNKSVVFTYGDTLYNPSGAEIPRNLEIHEGTHAEQQGITEEGIKEWWNRYLADKDFRLEQEVEAYRNQYKYIVEHGADRNTKRDFLRHIAQDLSGPIYGHIVSFEKAKELIKQVWT